MKTANSGLDTGEHEDRINRFKTNLMSPESALTYRKEAAALRKKAPEADQPAIEAPTIQDQ